MEIFDNENTKEIIHNIKEIIHCPFCGSNYHENNIRIVGKMSGSYVLHLICQECRNGIMANLSYRGNERISFSEEVFELARKGPITNNDIMDFIKNIKDFDGNFQKIFTFKKINQKPLKGPRI